MGAEGRARAGQRAGRRAAVEVMSCVVAWLSVSSHGFVAPSPGVWGLGPRCPTSRSTCGPLQTRHVVMAGEGFGKSVPPSPSKPPGASDSRTEPGRAVSARDVGSWEREYKAYVKRTGQFLCSMSWEGHEEMGRGAIFANYDDAMTGGTLDDADKFGGIPSMYVPLKDFEGMQAAEDTGEDHDLAQILFRVRTYRPETEFVVVFQAAGVMGTDVVRPSVPPPEMVKYVLKQETAASTRSSGRDDGVIDVTPVEE